MSGKDNLYAHLATGVTTVCRAWRVERADGTVFGFTDHDGNLEFEGTAFKANTGLSAGMLQQSNGLAVNNTEVMGALSDDGITEADLLSGRFDGAKVVTWLVNWQDLSQRVIRFRGTFGEIRVSGGAFRVELRGLTDPLDQKRGKIIQATCGAKLGDLECRFDLGQANFTRDTVVKAVAEVGVYLVPSQPGLPDRWFEWGRALVITGRAAGLDAAIRSDREEGGLRKIGLMVDFEVSPEPGDEIQVIAGCDKSGATCREKFGNFLNFRGFPHVPGADWLASYPVSTQRNDGSSRYK